MADLVRAWPGGIDEHEAIMVPNDAQPMLSVGTLYGTIGLVYPKRKEFIGAPLIITGSYYAGTGIGLRVLTGDTITVPVSSESEILSLRNLALSADLASQGSVDITSLVSSVAKSKKFRSVDLLGKSGYLSFVSAGAMNFYGFFTAEEFSDVGLCADFFNLFSEGPKAISAMPFSVVFSQSPLDSNSSLRAPDKIWICHDVDVLIDDSGRIYVAFASFEVPTVSSGVVSLRGISFSVWTHADDSAHFGSFWSCLYQDYFAISDFVPSFLVSPVYEQSVSGPSAFSIDPNSSQFPTARICSMFADTYSNVIYYGLISRIGTTRIVSLRPLLQPTKLNMTLYTGNVMPNGVVEMTVLADKPVFGLLDVGDTITISPTAVSSEFLSLNRGIYGSFDVVKVLSDTSILVRLHRDAPYKVGLPPFLVLENVKAYVSAVRKNYVTNLINLHDGAKNLEPALVDLSSAEERARRLYFGFANSSSLAVTGDKAILAYTGRHNSFDAYSLRTREIYLGDNVSSIKKSYSVGPNGSISSVEVRNISVQTVTSDGSSVVSSNRKAIVVVHNQGYNYEDIASFLRPYSEKTTIRFTSGYQALINLKDVMLEKVVDVIFQEPRTDLSTVSAKHVTIIFLADNALQNVPVGVLNVDSTNSFGIEIFPGYSADVMESAPLSLPLVDGEIVTGVSRADPVTSLPYSNTIGIIYVCTNRGRIFMSLDSGRSWNECYTPTAPGNPVGKNFIPLNSIHVFPSDGTITVNETLNISDTNTYYNGIPIYRVSGFTNQNMAKLNAWNLSYIFVRSSTLESAGSAVLSGLYPIPPCFEDENGNLINNITSEFDYRNSINVIVSRGGNQTQNYIHIVSRMPLGGKSVSGIRITAMPTVVACGANGTILLSEGGLMFKAIATAMAGDQPKYLKPDDLYPGYRNDFGDLNLTKIVGEVANPLGEESSGCFTYRATVYHRGSKDQWQVSEFLTAFGSVFMHNSRRVPDEVIFSSANYPKYPHGMFICVSDRGDIIFMHDILRNLHSRPSINHGRSRINDVVICRYKLNEHMGVGGMNGRYHPVLFAMPKSTASGSGSGCVYVTVIRRIHNNQPIFELAESSVANQSSFSVPSQVKIANYAMPGDFLHLSKVIYGQAASSVQYRIVAADADGNLYYLTRHDYTEDDTGSYYFASNDRIRSSKYCVFTGVRLASTGIVPLSLTALVQYVGSAPYTTYRTIIYMPGNDMSGRATLKVYVCSKEPIYRKLNQSVIDSDLVKLDRARGFLLSSTNQYLTTELRYDDGLNYLRPTLGAAKFSSGVNSFVTDYCIYVRDMDSYNYQLGESFSDSCNVVPIVSAQYDMISYPIAPGCLILGRKAIRTINKYSAYSGVSLLRDNNRNIIMAVTGIDKSFSAEPRINDAAILLYKASAPSFSFENISSINISPSMAMSRTITTEKFIVPRPLVSPDNRLYVAAGRGHLYYDGQNWVRSAIRGLRYPLGRIDNLINYDGTVMKTRSSNDNDNFDYKLSLSANTPDGSITWPHNASAGQVIWPVPLPIQRRAIKFTKYGFAICAIPCISYYADGSKLKRGHDRIAILIGSTVSPLNLPGSNEASNKIPIPIVAGTERWLGIGHVMARFEGEPDYGDSYYAQFQSITSDDALTSRSPSEKLIIGIAPGSGATASVSYYSLHGENKRRTFMLDSVAALRTNFRRLVVQVAKPNVMQPPSNWNSSDYNQFVIYSTVNEHGIGTSPSYYLNVLNNSSFTYVVRVDATMVPGLFKPGRRQYYLCIRKHNSSPAYITGIPILDNTKNEILLAYPVSVSGSPNNDRVQIYCDRFYSLFSLLRENYDSNGNPMKASTGVRFVIHGSGNSGDDFQSCGSSNFEIGHLSFGLSSLYSPIMGRESRRRPSRGFQQEYISAFERHQSSAGFTNVQFYNDRPRLRLTLEYNDALWHDRDATMSQLMPYLVKPVILAFNVKDCNSVDLVELEEAPVITNTHGDRYTYSLKFTEVI